MTQESTQDSSRIDTVIPANLRGASRWLVWAVEREDGEAKKVPRSVEDTSRRVSVTDPRAWFTYGEAFRATMPGFVDGLGFALGDGWAGVDLDGCRDPETGEIHPAAREIVDQLDSYTEVSPSGTGLKVFLRGEKPGPKSRAAPMPWEDWAQERGIEKTAEVEVYDEGRYFTVTGDHLDGTPTQVRESPERIETLYEDLFGAPDREGTDVDADAPAVGVHLADDDLLDRARDADNGEKFSRLYDEGDTAGYPSASEADQALMNMLAFWTAKDRDRMDRLFRGSALMRDKWDTRPDYRARTINTAVGATDDVFDPQMRLSVDDFWAYLPKSNAFFYRRNKERWSGANLNRLIPKVEMGEDSDPMPATEYLIRHRGVTDVTWWPGEGEVLKNLIVTEGGLRPSPGDRLFNQYLPPRVQGGDPDKAEPWLKHVRRLYPNEAEHLIKWFAQRVQDPGEKINHAIVLGGGQGIGKDTILEPVRHAVGNWNVKDISPTALKATFNPWVKTVILVASEARDLGDRGSGMTRYELYDRTKTYAAAPPDFLKCNVKYLSQFWVPNVLGLIFTTNHRDGLYIPRQDRRHFVAWSEIERPDKEYFNRLYDWFGSGGMDHVAAYLRELDLSDFNPKAQPPKTPAWHAMVAADQLPEDVWLDQALEAMGRPDALLRDWISDYVSREHRRWMKNPGNYKRFTKRMENLGYVQTPNQDDERGRWKIHGKRTTGVYARSDLTHQERMLAIREIKQRGRPDDPDEAEPVTDYTSF